jgi:hypothetical protein
VSDAVVAAGESDALDAGEAEAAAVPVTLAAGEPDADAAGDGVASAVTVVVLELSPLPHDANAGAARVKAVIVAIARNNANSHESYRPQHACRNLAPALPALERDSLTAQPRTCQLPSLALTAGDQDDSSPLSTPALHNFVTEKGQTVIRLRPNVR